MAFSVSFLMCKMKIIILILKLKLQYCGHLMQRTDSLEKHRCWERFKAGGEADDRGWAGWMASLMWWMWLWVGSGSWWWTGKPGVLQFTGSQRVGHDWATELTELTGLFWKLIWDNSHTFHIHCLTQCLFHGHNIWNINFLLSHLSPIVIEYPSLMG